MSEPEGDDNRFAVHDAYRRLMLARGTETPDDWQPDGPDSEAAALRDLVHAQARNGGEVLQKLQAFRMTAEFNPRTDGMELLLLASIENDIRMRMV